MGSDCQHWGEDSKHTQLYREQWPTQYQKGVWRHSPFLLHVITHIAWPHYLQEFDLVEVGTIKRRDGKLTHPHEGEKWQRPTRIHIHDKLNFFLSCLIEITPVNIVFPVCSSPAPLASGVSIQERERMDCLLVMLLCFGALSIPLSTVSHSTYIAFFSTFTNIFFRYHSTIQRELILQFLAHICRWMFPDTIYHVMITTLHQDKHDRDASEF